MAKIGLSTIHPGAFLAETLEELGLSQAAFARIIGVSPMRISHVIKGARPVTAELALRFGRAAGPPRESANRVRSSERAPTRGAPTCPTIRFQVGAGM